MHGNVCNSMILGAGLAGLSAAYHGGGTVYEKSERCGGVCKSPAIDGYVFDMGIHVLHTRNEYVLRLLQQDLQIKLLTNERSARICSYGTLTRYPFQANTFGLPIPVVKECLVSFIEASLRRHGDNNHQYHNYEDWIVAVFGKGIADHFMIPYSEKFWTVPPRDLTTDWMDIRIPLPTLEEVVEGALTEQAKEFGPNAVFRYPVSGGIAALPEAFLKKGAKVCFRKEAVKIDPKNKTVLFSDGSSETYGSLISTLPLPELIKIVEVPDEVLRAVSQLSYNSIICVNLGIDRVRISEHDWIYYPEEQYSFFRISLLNNFSSAMAPAGKSSLTAEISYSSRREINRDTIVETVKNDLKKAGVLRDDDRVEVSDMRDIKYAYVIYDHKRKKSLATIKKFCKEQSIILAGRYGNWEYQWMDDAILDGKRAAEEAKVV